MVMLEKTNKSDVGYYLGDASSIQQSKMIHLRNAYTIIYNSNQPKVVDAIELKQWMQKIDGEGKTSSLREMSEKDNWKNTVAGQHRIKLQERQARFAVEEAKRAVLDECFAKEEAQRRADAVEKAKKMMYVETDLVKAFHSRVNQLQAIEERDMQIALKYARRNAGSNQDAKFRRAAKVAMDLESIAEQERIHQKKAKQLSLAKDQLDQQKVKQTLHHQERKADEEEGRKIIQDDAEYKAQQAQDEIQRKSESKIFNGDLENMRKEVQLRRQEDKAKALIEDKKIAVWVGRKAAQAQLKGELEKKDGITIRQQMGDAQHRATHDADNRIEEQVKMRVNQREQNFRLADKQRQEKKEKEHDELQKFFEKHLKQIELKKAKTKAEDGKILADYIKIRDDAIAQKEAGRLARLNNGKLLQDSHLEQISKNTAMREAEKIRMNTEAEHKNNEREIEEMHLLEYMKEVAQESYAVDNNRLQTYIKSQVKKAPVQKYSKASTTATRLGFANVGFTKADLAGTNVIARGNFLDCAGDE